MGNLSIIDTSPTSLTLQAHVNFTNPTNYSAVVPYFNANCIVNGSVLAQAVIKDTIVRPGNNSLVATIVWDPSTNSGDEGRAIGRELLSQYVSGYNVSLTVRTHRGSIPAQPYIGSALSHFPLTFPMPRLGGPSDSPSDDPKKNHFIRETVMHILSSTAIFTIASPFASTTLYLDHMNATAYYEGHPAGKILYDLPFAVPPGVSTSPRLPVDWSMGGLGYDAIKKALGGELKLSAFAEVGIRIGRFRDSMWYEGKGIGAKIRL